MHEPARKELVGYHAHCTALDHCVGELLTAVKELDAEQDTLVVFTSDHGEMMGPNGCAPGQKQTVWNESASVPFLLRCRPIHGAKGRTLRRPLNAPDIMPTLLSLVGLPVPETVEDSDWADVVRGDKAEPDSVGLHMSVAPFDMNHAMDEFRAIRSARYTHARNLDGPSMLFDNDNDPYQMENLIENPDHAALRDERDGRLQDALKGIGDEFQPRGFYVRKWGYSVDHVGSIPYWEGSTMQSPRRKSP